MPRRIGGAAKGGYMTFGNLCDKIKMLVGADEFAAGENTAALQENLKSAMIKSIDMCMRKVAVDARALKKSATMTFYMYEGKPCANKPDDFFAEAEPDGVYAGADFLFAEKAGTYTIVYYAYPTAITSATSDSAVLELDDIACDAVAYAAAAELCQRIYPDDRYRYMRLMTEYDDRMTAIYKKGISARLGSIFSAKRGKLQ